MGTIVVAHGAGVREDGIAQLEQQVKNGIANVDILAGYNVEMCKYGPNVGAAPIRVADTLPEAITSREVGAGPDDDDKAAALWSLLFGDPVFELRIAATAKPASRGGVVIGGDLAGAEIRDAVLGLKAQDDLPSGDTGISREEFLAAVDTVGTSRELREAAAAVGDETDSGFVGAAARSIVAVVIAGHRHDAQGTLPPMVANGNTRDAFVEILAGRLVPVKDRAISDWLKDRVGGFIASRATVIAADHRVAAQEAASLVVADVLHYLRRPEDIAAYVRDCLSKAARPIIALGHSLGGIVLVDVLSAADHPPVDLLVTVGSQSPILFSYDALERPRSGPSARLPYAAERPPFTPWLNIYNRNDFVSFKAREIFRNELSDQKLDIEDQELHLPRSFPAAHGDYWSDPWTFKFIGERVARLPSEAGRNP